MGLLMDESARRSYDADCEDLRGRLVSPALSRHDDLVLRAASTASESLVDLALSL